MDGMGVDGGMLRVSYGGQDQRGYEVGEMSDPIRRGVATMEAITQLVLPVLLDRLGGSATVTEDELAALEARYGGGVEVTARRPVEGTWSFSLAPGRPGPERPLD
jgi:hypothetical protein